MTWRRFTPLDQLATRGIGTARIAVRSDEAPAELLHAADVTVDLREGAAALLRDPADLLAAAVEDRLRDDAE